ncbi:hypothetical protein ACQCVK_12485 [Rossellomorea vietnamensis]|nr:hypothetical protein [Rossellomorea aquimaris]
MKAERVKKAAPKKVTRFKEVTRMTKENEKALKLIKSFKGMFG